ncbi:3-hydroxyacyl-CoA dehydrogenase [Leptodontidium sp. 2 PMI_412]|nr:3-hydroxyacyl-CoA dehydrogenase [Leptodontidium sp. 2 PMI_412]
MEAHQQITLIGLGTIGISMAALHLLDPLTTLHLFDTRPDVEEYIHAQLPTFLTQVSTSISVTKLISSGRIRIHKSLEEACASSTIVQEQGPENVAFKRRLWAQVEKLAPPSAHFWSSTSGIAASLQNADMCDKSRLLVVHPFNPPHIMPLLEVVPTPGTDPSRVEFVKTYFAKLSPRHRPVVIRKEVPGIVGNRLAFALLREACHLVHEKVVDPKDLDTIMMASLGPRWTIGGVFEGYNSGGGNGGFDSFLNKLENTIQEVWDDLGKEDIRGESGGLWREQVVSEVMATYGEPTLGQGQEREAKLMELFQRQSPDRLINCEIA